MKEFHKFWWAPPHQPFKGQKVEFELQPLDQRTWLYLKSELKGRVTRVTLTPDGFLEAFRYSVMNWRGLPEAFSEEAKDAMMYGVANENAGIWQAQIAGELMHRVRFPEAAVKNS